MTLPATLPHLAPNLSANIAAALVLVAASMAIGALVRMKRVQPQSPTRFLMITPFFTAIGVLSLSGADLFFPGRSGVMWLAVAISFASSIAVFVTLGLYRKALRQQDAGRAVQ